MSRLPSMRGVTLRPIGVNDYDALRMAEFTSLGPGWRFAGTTPSPQAFMERVWHGVTVQLLCVRDDDGQYLGWFQSYNTEPDQGITWLAAANFGGSSAGFGLGMFLFLDYLFDTFPLRKVYIESPAALDPLLARLTDILLVEEGRLRERVFRGGQYVDVSIHSLERSRWESSRVRGQIAEVLGVQTNG